MKSSILIFVASVMSIGSAVANSDLSTQYISAYYEASKLAESGGDKSQALQKEARNLCSHIPKEIKSAEKPVEKIPAWELGVCEQAMKKFKLGSCTTRSANLARVLLRAEISKECKL